MIFLSSTLCNDIQSSNKWNYKHLIRLFSFATAAFDQAPYYAQTNNCDNSNQNPLILIPCTRRRTKCFFHIFGLFHAHTKNMLMLDYYEIML